jgi:hypothetical protein
MTMEDDTLYDPAEDNDGLPEYSSHYNAQRPYRAHLHSDPAEFDVNLGRRWGRILDFLTGPRFAFLVAIFVIVVFQFQGKKRPAAQINFHHPGRKYGIYL